MKKGISVIDDNGPGAIEIALGKLNKDYQMIGFKNPLTALEVVKRSSPSLIILDNEMPGMTGLEFLDALTKTSPCEHVIMFSSAARKGMEMKAVEHSAYLYIQKLDEGMCEVVSNYAIQEGDH